MSAKKTQEDFTKEAISIHGNKYTYDKVVYINNITKVILNCEEHGDFLIRPKIHLKGQGCPICSSLDKSKYFSKGLEKFIEDSKKIHGVIYTYDNCIYINNKINVLITCKTHGDFSIRPDSHLGNLVGCHSCSGYTPKIKFSEFLESCHNKYADLYEYAESTFVNMSTHVSIICKEHGEFKTTPYDHLNRNRCCPKCSHNVKLTNDLFCDSANKINNYLYDYTLVDVSNINNKQKVSIICNKHGVFTQGINNHLRGQGCPNCRNSKGEQKLLNYFVENDIEYIRNHRVLNSDTCFYFDFYLPILNIYIEYDGRQHYEPVEVFGGIVEFEKNVFRDQCKNKYCEDNNMRLFRIRYDEDIFEKMNEILWQVSK